MSNPGFEISILQRNKLIQFEPSFAKFQEVILRVYDKMIEAVSNLPRLETKLYIDLEDSPKELKVDYTPVEHLVFTYVEHFIT